MGNCDFLQIKKTTHEEKIKMYSKLTKKQLVEMLVTRDEYDEMLGRPEPKLYYYDEEKNTSVTTEATTWTKLNNSTDKFLEK